MVAVFRVIPEKNKPPGIGQPEVDATVPFTSKFIICKLPLELPALKPYALNFN
jgi:hypothetical protein